MWAVGLVMVAQYAAGQSQEGTGNATTEFSIAPRAYIQIDWRDYHDWTVTPGTGRLEFDEFGVRRLRAGIDGQWKRMTFEFTVDPEDFDGTLVKDAYAQVRFNRAVRVRVGQFKVPGGLEYQISARSLDFLERSALASSIAAGRDIGAMVLGRLGGRFEIQAGAFAGDGNGRSSRSQLTSAGRLQWNATSSTELGASMSVGRISSIDTDPANGLEGRSSSGYRFFERVYVQGLRVRTGADAQWSPGRWRLAAEWLRTEDQRDGQGVELEDLPSVHGAGWSVAVTRLFGRGKGRPRIREWDLGVRFDSLSFDDSGPATSTDSVRPRAVDIRPKAAGTLTTAVSWSPLRWAKVIGEGALERFDDSRSAPEAGRNGMYWRFGTRLQVELP